MNLELEFKILEMFEKHIDVITDKCIESLEKCSDCMPVKQVEVKKGGFVGVFRGGSGIKDNEDSNGDK